MMPVAGAPEAASSRTDGRRLRSARTSQLIIEAYLALLRDKPQIPTAARIAERAGYSVRSVFERFPDLHALRVAATDYAMAQATVQAPLKVEGDRQARLAAYVETRGGTCERWLPLWRALNANKGESADLNNRILLVRRTVLRRIELMFEAELALLEADRRRRTLIALDTLLDFESWGRMRDDHGLSVAEACTVWREATLSP